MDCTPASFIARQTTADSTADFSTVHDTRSYGGVELLMVFSLQRTHAHSAKLGSGMNRIGNIITSVFVMAPFPLFRRMGSMAYCTLRAQSATNEPLG